jgi:hypothetical protein
VDGSGHADHAVQTVAKLAAETRDKVVVFHGVVVHQAKGSPFTETRDMVVPVRRSAGSRRWLRPPHADR